MQDICDKNDECDGFTLENNKAGCFIKNINTELDPIRVNSDSNRKIFVKTDKWKSSNSSTRKSQVLKTCSNDCKINHTTGQLLDNQSGCIYKTKTEDNSKYIHMGFYRKYGLVSK